MINPTDKKYPIDPKNPDDKRPVITTFDEYMEIALNAALGAAMNLDKNGWNERIQNRYDSNKGIGFLNMRTFSKDLVGRTTNIHDIFELQNRLDDFIKMCNDPVNKTMAMAVRNVTEPIFDRAIGDNLFTVCNNAMCYVEDDYRISKEVRAQIRAKDREVSRNISGKKVNGAHADILTCDFDDLPSMEQILLISSIAKSFTDRRAMVGDTGEVLNATTAGVQMLEKVNAEAVKISDAVLNKKNSKYKASSENDKRDFEALVSARKEMDTDEKEQYSQRVSDFKSNNDYANMDISVNVDHLDLSLENNPIVNLSADEFIKKQKNDSLDNTETEWGEANIDMMLRSFYTDDEYKALKRAGIDPAMGILVNGKPLNWFGMGDNTFKAEAAKSDTLNRAKQKCNVVAQALDGAKIDVFKFVPDDKGGFKRGPLVPIKTDLSMKSEKRSIWQWILQFLGFSPKVKTVSEKVKEANEDKRDYLKYFDTETGEERVLPTVADDMRAQMKRDDVARRASMVGERDRKELDDLYKDYAGGLRGPGLSYTDFNGNSGRIFNTLGRNGSLCSIITLYGMVQGHTYDEMTKISSEGSNLRKQVVEDFKNEFSVVDYEDYLKAKGIKDGDGAKKSYTDYIMDKKERVEIFALKGMEALGKERFELPDPYDQMGFAENYSKTARLGEIAQDLVQSISPLANNKLIPTDPEVKKRAERSEAVFNYVNTRVAPITDITFCMQKYGGFLASNAFVGINEEVPDSAHIMLSAQSKNSLKKIYDMTRNVNTISDLIDNSNLSNDVGAVAFFGRDISFFDNHKKAKAHLECFLRPENPVSTIAISDDFNKVINMGTCLDLSQDRFNIVNDFNKATNAMNAYVNTKDVIEKGGMVSEAFIKNVEKEKNTQRNPIPFNELIGATNEKTTKLTAKAPVKSTELKAEKKAPEME